MCIWEPNLSPLRIEVLSNAEPSPFLTSIDLHFCFEIATGSLCTSDRSGICKPELALHCPLSGLDCRSAPWLLLFL